MNSVLIHSPRAASVRRVHVVTSCFIALSLGLALCAGPVRAESSASVHAGSGKGVAKTPDGSWRSSFLNKGNPNDIMVWDRGAYEADGAMNRPGVKVETKFVVTGCNVAPKDPWQGFIDHLAGPLTSFADGTGKGYSKQVDNGTKGSGYYSFWSVFVKGGLGNPPTPSFDTRAHGEDPWCLSASAFDSIPGPHYDLFIPVSLERGQFSGRSGIKMHVSYETGGGGDVDLLDMTIGSGGVIVTGSAMPQLSFFLRDSLTQGPPEDTDLPVTTAGIRAGILARMSSDSLTAPVCVGVVLHDIPIPTLALAGPVLASAARAATASCEPTVAKIHVDAEAFASDADAHFTVTQWSGTTFPPGDPAMFVAPELTTMVDVHFDPSGLPGPGASNGNVSLYGLDDVAGWVFMKNWEWTPGTVQSFATLPGVGMYRLVDCGDGFTVHTGYVDFLTESHALPFEPPATLPDFALGAVDHQVNPFNATLGAGGGLPSLFVLNPMLPLQSIPEYIGANHWQYLPLQVQVQPDFSRPWLYVNSNPNQPLLQPTWVTLSLDGLFDPAGAPINSLPIRIDFFQGATHLSFQQNAHSDANGHVVFPSLNLGQTFSQSFVLRLSVPTVVPQSVAAEGRLSGWRSVDATSLAATATQVIPGYFSMNALIVSGSAAPTTGVGPSEPGVTTGLSLAAATPNPFQTATRFEFANDRREHVRITIFDLSGRAVCDLADGTFAAGRHVVSWDGRDASRRSAPAGVYYARLDDGSTRQMRRVSLLR